MRACKQNDRAKHNGQNTEVTSPPRANCCIAKSQSPKLKVCSAFQVTQWKDAGAYLVRHMNGDKIASSRASNSSKVSDERDVSGIKKRMSWDAEQFLGLSNQSSLKLELNSTKDCGRLTPPKHISLSRHSAVPNGKLTGKSHRTTYLRLVNLNASMT